MNDAKIIKNKKKIADNNKNRLNKQKNEFVQNTRVKLSFQKKN